MDEPRRDEEQQEEVKLPDERVEDLEPKPGEADDVQGGAWPKKYTGVD